MLNRIFFLGLIFLFASPLHAHRLNVFVYPEEGRIHLESYFSRGSACMGCEVEVVDSSGAVVKSGTTDEEGRWAFVPSVNTGLSVVVTASEGHRAEYTLLPQDYPIELTRTEGTAIEEVSSPEPPEVPPPAQENVSGLSAAEVERIVERALEKKLAPIRQDLKRMQVDEPGINEVVTGIGYLFGLCGVAMFFLSKSGKKPDPQ